MIYNNLLFFLVAIFLFSVSGGADVPLLPFPGALGLFFSLLFLYDRICGRVYGSLSQKGSAAYFSAEKRLSLLALVFYAVVIFSCNIHYYLTLLSLKETLPALTGISGIFFFFLFLFLQWRQARPVYERLFGQEYSTSAFLLSNIRINLPIILPWVFLSLAYDLLALLPFPEVATFLHSESGEYVSFVLFLLLILIFFPPLVRRLWGCTPFPPGPLLDHLQSFFTKQRFSARMYLWPLFEGRVLTAGVMGIIPGLRYVMITPALLEALELDEIEAVMAHEIGHIKKKHMLLYLFIIVGFSVLTGFIFEPFTFFLLSRDTFYTLLQFTGLTLENLVSILMAVIVLGSLILYFRFLFGFFIRNFERQADLHVFEALGSSDTIISALEKIAILSGNIRDLPSWHHFGIGQRVDFLTKCELEPAGVDRHNRKVRLSLLVYVLALVLIVSGRGLLPVESWKVGYEEKYIEYLFDQRLMEETDKALWLSLAGDMLQHKKLERRALLAYNKALALEPSNPKLLNNLAWLLLTSDNPDLRDPERALELALMAAEQGRSAGYVLDTLARAYWANGLVGKAIETEKQAILANPEEEDFYRRQMQMFNTTVYEPKEIPTLQEKQ